MALALLLFTNGNSVSAAPDPPPTYVWGDIDANTTWVSGSLHIVNSTNPIHITNGAILTIQPNAVVRFDNGTGLMVEDGKLIADASNSPALITFTSNYSRATTVLWDGITIGEDGSATFKNVAISYADTAIAVDNGSIDISNVKISTVYTGVAIVKDTTALDMTISKLMVNNYRDEGLLLTAHNLTLDLELKDSAFNGGARSIGIDAISTHVTTGAAVVTLNNVTVTGGETGAHLLAQTRLSASIVNCKFNSQWDTAVAADSISGDSTMDMQGTTIDGRGSSNGQTIYTVNEDPSYMFQMIEPALANRTAGPGGLSAVLPWDFTYNGVSYTDVYMARNGSVRLGTDYNWIAPCNNVNFLTNDQSSFYGYVVSNNKAVFQWSVYINGDDSDRMDVFQLILYKDGNITFVYDLMESNAVGQAFLKVSSGLSFDIDMVIGNPFDLGHSSYTLRPQDLSTASGLVMTTVEGNITLNVNNSILRNLGDGALITFAGNGRITEDVTNSQILNVYSGTDFGAINVETLNGTVDVTISKDVFNTIWGYAFWVQSNVAMGGSDAVMVNDNQFVRCAFTGVMDSNVDFLSQALRATATMGITRTFNNNALTDSGIFTSRVDVNVENNGWNLIVNEQMVSNDYRTVMYTGMLPYLVNVGIDDEAMMASDLFFIDSAGTAKNNVWHNLTVADNVIDGLPTFTGFNGRYFESVPKGIVCSEDFWTAASDNAIWSKVEVMDNTISASGATNQVLVSVDRAIRSFDGNRTSDLQTVIMDNMMSGARSDGIQVTLWDGAYENDLVATTNVVNNVVKVVNNTVNGCDLAAMVGFTHMRMNQVGMSTISDAFWFNQNKMTGCAEMLTFDNDYTNGFDDFYPSWGSPVTSSLKAAYQAQVINNSFEGNDFGAAGRIDVTARTTVPGDAIYCSASSIVNGSISILGNDIELTAPVITEPMVSPDVTISAIQYYYADGRNAVTTGNSTILVADNHITGDTVFNGITVSTGAYASTTQLRDDLADHPIVTSIFSVMVRNNTISGAYDGIDVTHYAHADYAMSEVRDTYDATISDNVVEATSRGIWVYVSDQTLEDGTPAVSGRQHVQVNGNDVNGNGVANGIQLQLTTHSANPTGLNATATFILNDNKLTDCDEGIYAEMSPDAAQEQLLVVNMNVVTNTVDDGIYVIGGKVNVLNNTVMEGTGYGIYVEDASGSVNGNTVSGFSSSGIYLDGCFEMEVVDNIISGCANDDDWALYIDHGDHISLKGNLLEMNYRGLYALGIADSIISDNEIRGCTYQGVELIGLVSCLVENNIISDNGAFGVYIDGGNGLVFGNNTVTNNEGIGVDIDADINDQIWLYNGMYEYNDGYGIYIEASPYAPSAAWYGVKWIIDGESRVTFNDVWFDGEISIMSGGSLYLDSVDCFQLRGSSVDGTATLLIEAEGMLSMLNTNLVSSSSDEIFEPMSALSGPVSTYYEFIVFGILQAEECSILHAESIYLGPTSYAELIGCLIANYEDIGIQVDSCSPTVSECVILGDPMGGSEREGIVIDGDGAYPQIVGCMIIANRHGIYARDTDLGAVYDNIFMLNHQAGIYGENVSGRIHDNVFMLNKVEILLTNSNVTITDNQIGWAKMIDELAQYVPFIELVGHHMFEILNTSEGLTGTEGDLMDSLFGLDVTDLLLGHVGVMAMGCERLVMSGNWYGMLYQAVYIMDCPDLKFGDRIAPSNLTIPYYVGINKTTMTLPIQCVDGLYAVRTNVQLVNAYIEVLDDAVVVQDCTGSVFNSKLMGGDKALLVVPSAQSAGAEGGGFEVKTLLKVHAEKDDGNSVSGTMVKVYDAFGVEIARGETDENGDFVCSVVSSIVTASGVDKTMNPYKVTVEFENGDVSKEISTTDPMDGSWTTSMTVTADPDWTWTFVGVTILAIITILIVVALIVRKKKSV